LVASLYNLVVPISPSTSLLRYLHNINGIAFVSFTMEVNKMKTKLTLILLFSFGVNFASSVQDSTQNQIREQKRIQKQQQQKNQDEDDQIKNQNDNRTGNESFSSEGKNKGKDVFIDKDGDGIADTRAGGMSFQKLRKRTRHGQQGGSGRGGNEGSGGKGGGK